MVGPRLIVVATLGLVAACGSSKSSDQVTCEQAYRHRGELMKARQGSGEAARLIEAATRNEIAQCKSAKRPQSVLRCYLTITAADLEQDMFAFEEKCDKLGERP